MMLARKQYPMSFLPPPPTKSCKGVSILVCEILVGMNGSVEETCWGRQREGWEPGGFGAQGGHYDGFGLVLARRQGFGY